MMRFFCSVVIVTLSIVTLSQAEDAPKVPKAAVSLHWLSSNRVEKVTERKGIQTSCDPLSIVYPHLEPILVLTANEVDGAELTRHDFSRSGLSSENYSVKLHLTKAARDKIAKSVEGNAGRTLTVKIDGKYWGMYRYEKNPGAPGVPEVARAESFTPSVGFFPSRGEAEYFANTFKKP